MEKANEDRGRRLVEKIKNVEKHDFKDDVEKVIRSGNLADTIRKVLKDLDSE